VVRSHEHIARIGTGSHECFQGGSLQVSSQQEPPARGLHRHHDARLVVGRPPLHPLGRIVTVPRVQHAHAAGRVEGKRVVSRHRADRNPRLTGQEQHLADGSRVTTQEGIRHDNFADRESLDQIRHGVEVISIGVGNDERIDVAQPLIPQHTFHRSPGGPWRAEASGVIHETAAPRTANHHATAVPHRRSNHPEAHRPRHRGGLEQTTDDPDDHPPTGQQPPGERLPQAIP
jgi:hypothetical protein